MGPISAGVRQLPCSDAIVAQEKTRRAVTHDIDSIGCSWVEEGHSFVDEVAAWVEEARSSKEDADSDRLARV